MVPKVYVICDYLYIKLNIIISWCSYLSLRLIHWSLVSSISTIHPFPPLYSSASVSSMLGTPSLQIQILSFSYSSGSGSE